MFLYYTVLLPISIFVGISTIGTLAGDEIGFSKSGVSYAQYEKWNASVVSSLRFKFSTAKRTGLLVYIDDGRQRSTILNYLLLALHSGELKMRVKMGEDHFASTKTVGDKLNDLEWHEIEIIRNYRATTIILDSMEDIITSNGKSNVLKVNSFLYIGGTPDKIREDESYKDFGRFIGCIKDVEIRYGQRPYAPPSIIFPLYKPRCLNKCIDKPSECHLGKCKNNFETTSCDCFGTGYEGATCRNRSRSYQLNGYSFVVIKERNLRQSSANKIQFRFKTHHPNGIIFTGGKSHDYLTIEMYRGNVRLTGDLGGGQITVSAGNHSLHDGYWHNVRISQKGERIILQVDTSFKQSRVNGFAKACDKDEADTFFIGGHFNPIYAAGSLSKTGYSGCLQQFHFNGEDILKAVKKDSKHHEYRVIGVLEDGCNVSKKPRGVGTSGQTGDMNNPSVLQPGESGGSRGDNTKKGNSNYESASSEADEESGKRFSQSTVGWITAGIVIGSVALILAVAFLVRHFKRKYSGSFVASSMNQNDYSSVHLYGGQPTYYVSNGKPTKGTHI